MRNEDRHPVRNARGSIMLLGAALLCWILPSSAYSAPTVFVDPDSVTVMRDEVFDVAVMIDAGVDTISNVQLFFQFDPTVLQFLQAVEGSLYTSSGLQTWFNAEEESLGTWEVFDVIFPSGSFILPPGELVRLRFKALADGTSDILLLSVTVTDIDRFPIAPINIESGHVSVGDVVGIAPPGLDPRQWMLGAPWPNPSRGLTRITLSRPAGATGTPWRLMVRDVQGRHVRSIGSSRGGNERFVLEWQGRDDHGRDVRPGVYFFTLVTSGHVTSQRLVLVQ